VFCAHNVAGLLGMPDAVLCSFAHANTSSLFVLFVIASLIHQRSFYSAWPSVSCDDRWQAEHAGSPAGSERTVKRESGRRSYVRVGPARDTNSHGGCVAHKIRFLGS